MRSLVVFVAVVLAVAAGLSVVAAAATTNGLPGYTNGYAKWRKLNKRPITTPGAHNGIKNVYASKPRSTKSKKFPNGTVIVKSIAEPGAKGLAHQVAVMRKVKGRWQWVEYELTGPKRYGVLAKGALCSSCHMQARANDWVFTKR